MDPPTRLASLYVSIGEMWYRPETQSIELSVKVFRNDLEEVIEAHTGTPFIYSPVEDKEVMEYAMKHIRLFKGEEFLLFRWIGSEPEDEVVFLHLEADLPRWDPNLVLEHSLFMETLIAREIYYSRSWRGKG